MAFLEQVAFDNSQLNVAHHSSQSDPRPSTFKKTQEAFRFTQPHIRTIILIVFGLSFVVAVFGTVWAIELGAAYPLAIMAGYSTFVATACLAFILANATVVEYKREQHVNSVANVSEAWKHVSKLRVSDAARLWCDIAPGAMVTQDAIAWGRVLLDAIESGELPCIQNEVPYKRSTSYSYDKPHWSTEVTRDALKAWARTRGFSPAFLQD